MKKAKDFDTVRTMREIRNQMSREMKGMSPKEQVEYIQSKSGLRRKKKQRVVVSG